MIDATLITEDRRRVLLVEAARLEALASDMRRIAEEQGPTAEDLADAPVLHGWFWGERAVPCLLGHVVGHPRLADGPATTSDVWLVDLRQRWARTLGRYYRLATPAADIGGARGVQ